MSKRLGRRFRLLTPIGRGIRYSVLPKPCRKRENIISLLSLPHFPTPLRVGMLHTSDSDRAG